MLNAAGDKSFVDDLVASGYCKCESSLCCYEALRFIPRFYDLFFLVLWKVTVRRWKGYLFASSGVLGCLGRVLGFAGLGFRVRVWGLGIGVGVWGLGI